MFKNGDLIEIIDTNLIGKIIRKNKKDILYTVEILPNHNILVISKDKIRLSSRVLPTREPIAIQYTLSNDTFNNEIMLRHQTVEIALDNLDKFVSDAISHKEKRIRIIHGRHGGILRRAVHTYLKESPYVQKYELADYFEGSYGVTIAYLK
ncbi:MAG: Smr/MutS family protein [Clostridia bacterium]|nr:Smr/MutS family protein [Clostridia bacterium]